MIFNKDLNEFHPFGHNYATNNYYTRFANRLLRKLESLEPQGFKPSELKELAVWLTLYFEDVVADSGQWRMFSHKCEQLYGFPVPIYHDEGEDYYVDEPSLDAVKYLVWETVSQSGDIPFADHPLYGRIALAAYELMDEAFEHAPVNERLARDINGMLALSLTDFNQLREVMKWIAHSCYCTYGKEFYDFLDDNIDENADLYDGDEDMAVYGLTVEYIFSCPTGPLALTCTEWLKAFYEVKGLKEGIRYLNEMEGPVGGAWVVEKTDSDKACLRSADGKRINATFYNMNLSPNELRPGFLVIAIFVKYKGEWQLNGNMSSSPVVFNFKPLEEEAKARRQRDDEVETMVKLLFKAAKGKRIVSFKDEEELRDFMRETLKDHKEAISELTRNPLGEHPQMFLFGEDDMMSMAVLSNIAQYISTPDNPYFDTKANEEGAVAMLNAYQKLPTRLMSELIAGDYIPALLSSELVCEDSTLEQKRHDLDFILRTVRRNNY